MMYIDIVYVEKAFGWQERFESARGFGEESNKRCFLVSLLTK